MAKSSDLVINDLRGGMNDSDPSHSLPDDQVVLAENIEFWNATLGSRRRGCGPIDITGSGLEDEDVIGHLGTHLPIDTDVVNTELWAIAATWDTSVTIAHRSSGTWAEVTPVDPPDTGAHNILAIRSASIHGKWFVAYKSDEDRMHVWDGITLRRTGLAAPALAPTAIDTASGGAFVGDRIYRVRFIEKSGSDILRRSEPSAELTFTPSGTNDGAIVTRPATIGEGETDWELEASDGDGNFYVIATTPIATTTATDTTSPSTDYAVNGVLSDTIGDYDVIPSVQFITADQDRLIFGGSWTDSKKGSRISWTPVYNAPGVGNDERIPLSTDNFLDLDWMDGGGLTGLSDPINGSFYAFKRNRVYKLQRTGDVNAAYTAFLMAKSLGAVPGSLINGRDEFGRPCVYFLDPSVGPARVGSGGIQHLDGILGTWLRVATGSDEMVAQGVYYPDHRQVWWWVAVDGDDTPSMRLCLQADQVRSDSDGTTRGWSVATGGNLQAFCSTVLPEIVTDEESGGTTLSFRPYAGYASPNFIQRCDTMSTDAGSSYRAILRTKPYILTGLLNFWGGMAGALLAEASTDPTVRLQIKLIRDFGLQDSEPLFMNFLPLSSEELIIRRFDNLRMSNASAIQIEFSDPE